MKRKNLRGFTLLEVVIALGMTMIVAVLLVKILVNNSGFSSKQTAIVNEGISLNDTLSLIDKDVREAVAAVVGYPEDTPTYTTSSTTLVVKLPALDSSGVISNVYDYLVITVDSTQPHVLRLQIFPDTQSIRQSSDQILTTILDTVEFTYLDKNGNIVSPAAASTVATTIKVLAKTGAISSSRSSKIITTLRNSP